MKKTFYITTPIYYPSGKLHIGHVYTTTIARTLANYKKMVGYDVRLLTGADEHGQKIEQKAKEKNIDPKQYVDEMAAQFMQLWDKIEIEYDYFSRTTSNIHKNSVSKQFSKFLESGDIFKGEYKGLYSIQDEEFLTKTQAREEDGKFFHPTSGHLLQMVSEESYFFKMSNYEKWWNEYVNDNPNFIIPKKVVTELKMNFINKGLSDLSVTRSTFEWGIPIKENPKHIIYVWLDALNNYITALGYNSDNDSDFKKFWVNGDEIVHVVGKEIARFHGIYWPIFLKAANLRQPTSILSHGWIMTPEGKMSKSKGNVIDPIMLIDKYSAEVVKYFFASQINIGQDGTFDELMLKNAYNSDLANNYGNLLSRTISMLHQNFDSPVQYSEPIEKTDKELFISIESHFEKYKELFDSYLINEAIGEAMSLGNKLNRYIDLTKPWTLKDDKNRLACILNNLLNGLYAMTTMLHPVIPKKSSEAINYLGFKDVDIDQILNFEKFNSVMPIKGNPLFERIK